METTTITNLPPITAFTSSRPLLAAVADLTQALALLPDAERDAETLRVFLALQNYASHAVPALIRKRSTAIAPADGGTFVYHLGMDIVRRAYYDVLAHGEDEAAAKLQAFALSELSFQDDVTFVTEDDDATDDPCSVGEAITITCVSCKSELEDEAEEEHDCKICSECGRSVEATHTVDCAIALAQDFEDGTISVHHDRYGDARAAYERISQNVN